MTDNKTKMSNPVGTTACDVAAIIGFPVSQSLSPAMHNAVFRQRNLAWTYVAMDVQQDALVGVLSTLSGGNITALSVTMPHKEAVFELLSLPANSFGEVDESAIAARSVNTISVRSGRLIGSNTDGDGCCDALQRAGVEINGVRAIVVGAGSTARAIVVALGRRGASDISVINRTESRAHDAAACSAHARVGSIADIARASVLINATSVGMGDRQSPISARYLHADLTVLDAVYYPLETTLLRDAKVNGAATVDGLWMLVHQGSLQQLAWLGESGDVLLMRQAALDELAHRAK